MRTIALLSACAAICAAYIMRESLFALRDPKVVGGGERQGVLWAGEGAAPAMGTGESYWPPELSGDVTIDLSLAPVASFGAVDELGEQDHMYRDVVERHGAVFDPHLSRAAREIAYQAGVLSSPPPEAALAFLLASAGATDSKAAQMFVRTNAEDLEPVERAVQTAVNSSPGGRVRIGVGETFVEDNDLPRTIVALISHRNYQIAPVSRVAEVDSEWRLRGRFPPGFGDALANVLYASGEMVSIPIESAGESFEVTIPTGSAVGTMRVGVSGVGKGGPGKLLQLEVEVGRPPPRSATVFAPDPAREAFSADEHEQAEAYALELLQRDRAAAGLRALVLDARLSTIARAHADEMRDRGYFGHQSPTTGLVGDRLRAGRYRAIRYAENLALNDSIGEAQASLLSSVGHRRNLLGRKFTRVGIGLSRRSVGDRVEWLVVQVFAQPVEPLVVRRARGNILAAVNRARSDRGLPPLAEDDQLTAIAQRHAQLAADDRLEELRQASSSSAWEEIDRLAKITAHQIYEVDGFDVPEPAFDERLSTIGIGVVQAEDDPNGRIGVVLIVAR